MRIDKVKEFVFSECAMHRKSSDSPGVTAAEVAEALNIQRSNASLELNELFNMGVLTKTNSRPVRYFPVETEDFLDPPPSTQAHSVAFEQNTQDIFTELMEKNPSLCSAFQLAKAAISYPPYGLNTLITGETGVGKSFFAERMWEYAVENQCFKNNGDSIPFVTFSCAEYSDNPQLLLSQLFGHVKGAFTGASESKRGIVEEANNGILFLDEIHRLPPTGQELLFMLMDKGVLRRLGDKEERHVNLMIICATTEDISNVLLKTFLRRIPVVIHIPSLNERTAHEKINLIRFFLETESKRLNIPIWISGQVLVQLIRFQPKGNVGELRNTINLCCARGYLNYISSPNNRSQDGSYIKIHSYDLPQNAYEEEDETCLRVLSRNDILSNGLFVSPDNQDSLNPRMTDEKYLLNLYGYVDKKLELYSNLELDSKEIPKRISRDLEEYYHNMITRLSSDANENIELIDSIIPASYKNIANDVINFAALKLNQIYSKSIVVALALHIQQFVSRSRQGKTIHNPNLEKIKIDNFAEMNVLKEIQNVISSRLGIPVTEDELGFWSLFLAQKKSTESREFKIGFILTGHGDTTASSMADFVNTLLFTNLVHAVDAPIHKSVEVIFSELCELVQMLNEGKGVLILADMGSFVPIEERLSRETGVSCRIIPCLTSILALEAAKVILSSNASLDAVYKQVYYNYYQYFVSQFQEEYEKERPLLPKLSQKTDSAQKIVMAVCSTGIGSAVVLKDTIETIIGHHPAVQVKTFSITENLTEIAATFGTSLKLIVGGINPNIKGIPFIGTDAALRKEGREQIRQILNLGNESQPSDNEDDENIFQIIEKKMNVFAPSLDAETAINACEEFYNKIKQQLKTSAPENYYVGIILHFLCMLERLQNNEPEALPDWGNSLINRNYHLYLKLKDILNEVCTPFHFTVPKEEICYYLQII